MALSIAERRAFLVDLISPAREVGPERVAALTADDWDAIGTMASQHRLRPLLQDLVKRKQPAVTVPDEIKLGWRVDAMDCARVAVVQQAALLRCVALLDQAGIEVLSLKGAFLAHHCYPQVWQRRLRDIDLLVDRERAGEAFAVLQVGGLVPTEKHAGIANAIIEAEGHHLPPLRSREGVLVELHTHLFHATNRNSGDLARDPALWTRAVERTVVGRRLRYLSPTDQLLHLAAHAAHDHQFNNGPLILSDVAYLLQAEAVDWPAFWALAETYGRTRASVLTLRLAERHWGDLGVSYAGLASFRRTVPEAVLDVVVQLLVRDLREEAMVKVVSRYSGRNRLRSIAGRFFRSRIEVAAYYGGDARSPFVFVRYLSVLWRGLSFHLPTFIRGRLRASVRHESASLSQLNEWLNQDAVKPIQ